MGGLTQRQLIHAGFQDLSRAQSFFDDAQLEELDREWLLRQLLSAPDADQALLLLIRLIERSSDVRDMLITAAGREAGANGREGGEPSGEEGAASGHAQERGTLDPVPLFRLLGASSALAEFLIRRPQNIDVLSRPFPAHADVVEADELRRLLLEAVGADPGDGQPRAALSEDFPAKSANIALRVAYRRELLALALRDLTAADPVSYQPLVSRQLADLAAAALEAAVAISRAEARAKHGDLVDRIEFAVIGMGKCGARELNYISDVDVIFVHRVIDAAYGDQRAEAGPERVSDAEAHSIAVELASGASRAITAPAAEPALWEVDANLRPEGKDGSLSRSLDSHIEYYKRWAHGWEFQALLKARPIAGSPELGQAYIEQIWPMVWTSSQQGGFVEDVQRMRRRVFENIPAETAAREIKLGRGGLRDIEFTVQLLQLVHGRVDTSLRVRDTLTAIDALADGVYMAKADQQAMSRCYRQLRLYEHRIQMSAMRRTHLMPEKEHELNALAQAVLPPNSQKRRSSSDLLKSWHAISREVASFHETIFYRPLLSTTAVLSDDQVRLTSEAAQDRLAALGYSDTAGAMRHIEALTSGVTRRATLQRRILPMMLGWFADGVNPDSGLLAFRRLSESLGNSPWYLTMLRDHQLAAERLCGLLSSSRFIADMLEHAPESTRWLGDDDALVPRSFEALWTEIRNKLSRHEGEAMTAVRLTRLVRQREVLRVAIADAVGRLATFTEVGRALADADRAAALGALHVAENEIFASEGKHVDILVVAMGRQGGAEISYGSDLDAMFVHRLAEGGDPARADEQAQKVVGRLTALLSKPVKPAIKAERPLQLDADLRPEGKKGPLSRSLDSFGEYYRRWMDVWERQALLRARPIAGSDDLAVDFLALIDPIRYGEPPSATQVREIRRIKARVEAERLPRAADPSRHVKLGRGGLSDVEWLVQLYQLEYAHRILGLRTPSTMAALDVLVEEEILASDEAKVLSEAWLLCSRVRSAGMIWSGKSSDVLPSSRRDLEAVARWCGFDPGHASDFEEHYLRTTRRARGIFERRFYEQL